MPTYPFIRVSDGAEFEITFPMKEVPPVGQEIRIGGELMKRRMLRSDEYVTNADPQTGRFPFASRVLPRNIPGEKCDERGRVIVRDQAHKDRLCERYNLVQE